MLTLTTSLLGNTARVANVPLTEQERDMLRWALETMGFVMPSRGVFTGQQWIDEIKAIYDPTQPHIAAAIAVIEKAGCWPVAISRHLLMRRHRHICQDPTDARRYLWW